MGRHLVALLAGEGARVLSLDRTPAEIAGAESITADLSDPSAVGRAVAAAAPDVVFHLASQTPGGAPGCTPAEQLVGDPVATEHLLEAVRRLVPETRVVVVSSSAVYGDATSSGTPIPETAPFRPVTPYGVAKAAVELVALRHHLAHGLKVVRVRPFNLVGPGQGKNRLPGHLAAQVVAVSAGAEPPVVRLRHRATSRDFVDVRDAARAFRALAELGEPGEVYNVGSGQTVSIGELLDLLLATAGVTARVEETDASPEAGDVRGQAADTGRIRRTTGWSAAIPLGVSLSDLLGSFRDGPT